MTSFVRCRRRSSQSGRSRTGRRRLENRLRRNRRIGPPGLEFQYIVDLVQCPDAGEGRVQVTNHCVSTKLKHVTAQSSVSSESQTHVRGQQGQETSPFLECCGRTPLSSEFSDSLFVTSRKCSRSKSLDGIGYDDGESPRA